ncbi:hypothetical protein [Streptomyces misionensis]|uniref:hypothetical protein n=1 Tax=Streptomyces misionensis TaxID=67331 RepID=UPI0036944506
MSAWAQIVNSDGSDEWLELCTKALLEVQAETSRRNAAKIRALGITQWEGMNESVRMLRKMRAQAADLIDPEAANGG